jgi:predicted nucleic acid-binding protein
MLIESDLLLPLIKKGDRLSVVSERVLSEVRVGRLTGVYASTAAIQEVVFWLYNRGLQREAIQAVNALKFLPNLEWVPLSPDICLEAAIIMKEYGVGPFDAYHAATALSRDSVVMSTEHVYGRIPGLSVLDPSEV